MSQDHTASSNQFARIAIVTGATSGIGEATTRKFLAQGFAVVGNGRTAAKLAKLEQELGPAFRGVAGDASDESILNQLFATAIEYFGKPVDIVIVNAGRGLGGSVKDADLTQFEEVLKINVMGALSLMQKAAQKMVVTQETDFPTKAADIVIIGSVVGKNISPFSAVYGSTKFAIHSLAEGLRREIGPKGVRVTLVEPGFILTGFQEVAGYSADMMNKLEENWGPMPHGDAIADAIHFVVTQPPHVHISEIMVRPTRQDYP